MQDKNIPKEKIGDFFVRIGVITEEQKHAVLRKQKQEPKKMFGQIALELGHINNEAIAMYLESKED